MRYGLGTAAALMVSSAVVMAASPVLAGSRYMTMDPRDAQVSPTAGQDVDQGDASNPMFNKAEGTMSTPTTQAQASARTPRHYLSVEPRDAQVDPNASKDVDQADASNALYNKAEGTMSTPNTPPPASTSNGQYVASYHQYMQMDPRDAKVDPNATAGADANDIYYYKSMGTMSHP